MMTAAVIPEEHAQSPLVTVLEGRVRKLEQELESRQKEEDKMLRAVEQKYNNIKVRIGGKGGIRWRLADKVLEVKGWRTRFYKVKVGGQGVIRWRLEEKVL